LARRLHYSLRMKRTWKQLLILNLSLALFSACGNVPLINGVLGIPSNGAVTNPSQSADGSINQDGSESDDPNQEQDNIENTGDIQGIPTGSSVSGIPGDSDTEVVIDTDAASGSSSVSGTTGASGVGNAATTESSGTDSGDGTTDSSAPGAETPNYLPSSTGPVDIPVSTAKEDDDTDGCTADNTGDVTMVMLEANTSRTLVAENDAGEGDELSRRSRRRTNIHVTRSTSPRTRHFSMAAGLATANTLPDTDGGVDGTGQIQQCQVQTDDDGEITHTWVPVERNLNTAVNPIDSYSVVVGHLDQDSEGHLIQSAVSVPLASDGSFHVDSALLNPTSQGFDYIGFLPKDADLNVEPTESLVIQATPTAVHIDMTNSLNTYVQTGSIYNSPAIHLSQTVK
jgi:hypothetical protein